MNYIIIFNCGNKDFFVHTSDHGFVEQFSSYDDAKKEAEECIDGIDLRDYTISCVCSGSRNYLV